MRKLMMQPQMGLKRTCIDVNLALDSTRPLLVLFTLMNTCKFFVFANAGNRNACP